LHPLELKTVLFAKHAQHVVLIHFPIALFIIGVLFDFLAQWKKQRVPAAAAYYNLLVAAIATIPVVITGIVAWQWELEGQKLKGVLLMHLVMGCASTVLIWAVWFIHRRTRPGGDSAGISLANRGCRRIHRRTNRTPWRLSQRSEWAGINLRGNRN
jgi:uncharacterized membrane protein